MLGHFFALSAATALSASSPQLPAEFQGAWGHTLEACEPEFTNGFDIGPDSIGYYEGSDELLAVLDNQSVETKAGLVTYLLVELTYEHAGSLSEPFRVRYTLTGKYLYRTEEGSSISKEDRYVRCPPGSTSVN